MSESESLSEWLDFMGLREYANREAGNLAYGHQRRLEIARCMITKPRLLMLDEPAAGMNASETVVLRKLIEKIRDDGVTVLLIEHDMKLVMGLCDRVLVLEYGKVLETLIVIRIQTVIPTRTATRIRIVIPTPTVILILIVTVTQTRTAIQTPTVIPTRTATPILTVIPTRIQTVIPIPTRTAIPILTPTVTQTQTVTQTPTSVC
ncbi:ATP-binding cassette domain-containing protein [Lactiplantibacillus plantarum]|uniref:ATP-binding cassette domain-containing protein n=1 Tax=Lactiplantibacillus plantarum TaxID=1590 RepID=UPI004045C13D